VQLFSEIKRKKQLNGFYRETLLFIVKNSSSSNIHFYLWHKPKYILILFYQLANMDINQQNNILFSPKYRIWRHVAFWTVQCLFFALLYMSQRGLKHELFIVGHWLPARMLYAYPLMYWALPKYLLKGKYVQFLVIIVLWVLAGAYFNYLYRAYVSIPLQEYMGFKNIIKERWQVGSLLVSMTTAFAACIIFLFKHWVKKQQEWLQAEKEKVTAELQLLKAQVHPHFLFNTLNNIYSFSLTQSPKTPELILKLSSLLNYMLYDCKAEQVLLEKEIEVMKDYVDLETERYGNKIEISWHVEGELEDKYVAPLLLLPFLENAFKHGTSEQLEKPWLSFDLVVKQNSVKCKVANSKNEFVPVSQHGIGIENVKKRLHFLYRGKHELKINDEGEFFVVSLLLELTNNKIEQPTSSYVLKTVGEKAAI
jgi:sensor histidine kinase YesM